MTKGFTLIELLVVITIIGILATGAVSVYTSQIQKARDTTRITDINALKGGLEQAFQDMGIYPGKAETVADTTACNYSATMSDSWLDCVVQLGFLNALPSDPKDGSAGNGSPLVYTYNVGDSNGVLNQQYEVSTGVEADGFKTSKAADAQDGWNDSERLEIGIPGVGINTCLGTACTTTQSTTWTSTANSCSVAAVSSAVIIRWACPAS